MNDTNTDTLPKIGRPKLPAGMKRVGRTISLPPIVANHVANHLRAEATPKNLSRYLEQLIRADLNLTDEEA